jgi:hypothetical protein
MRSRTAIMRSCYQVRSDKHIARVKLPAFKQCLITLASKSILYIGQLLVAAPDLGLWRPGADVIVEAPYGERGRLKKKIVHNVTTCVVPSFSMWLPPFDVDARGNSPLCTR